MSLKSTRLPLPVQVANPPARKVSAGHLDSLYQAAVLVLNLHGSPGSAELVGVLSSIHNHMVHRVDMDPVAAIALYVNLQRWFVMYVRGSVRAQETFLPQDWSLAHKCPTALIEFVGWYTRVKADSNITKPMLDRMLQVVMMLLGGHRVIVTPAKVNLDSIVKPLDVPGKIVTPIPHLVDALKELGITPEAFADTYKAMKASAKFNVITTAGPNGQATWTAHQDAVAIMRDGKLLEAMRDFAGPDLAWMLSAMCGTVSAPPELSGSSDTVMPIHSRLHAIEEWGGKTRVVAILDYYTQAILTPLHDTINSFLRNIPMDGTFDQDIVISKVQDWSRQSNLPLYSYDLTAATDRIPIELYKDVLGILLGSEAEADAWARLIKDRDFQAPDGTMVRYGCGQPMGAKSSFPLLALIHHCIIKGNAISVGKTGYDGYVVVGDDNAQTMTEVATAYSSYMHSIGVSINLRKSYWPLANTISTGEICKRLFVGGVELTALPPKLIVKTSKFGHMAPGLQNQLHKRGYPVAREHMLPFFASLIDRKSFQALLVLNSVPPTVSGLISFIDHKIPNLDLAKWYPGVLLKLSDISEAYTFALVTEQLKRVDQLLRGTLLMADIIALKSQGDPAATWPTELLASLPDSERRDALKKLPPLVWCHPITLAGQNELERVLQLLALLRSGSPEMIKQARLGLLDILRNSLSEIWLGSDEKGSVVTRSIFNSMLSALDRIVSTPGEKVLNFSILLSQVQRMWSVTWKLGLPVAINIVKTKISVSSDDARKRVADLSSSISIKNFRI